MKTVFFLLIASLAMVTTTAINGNEVIPFNEEMINLMEKMDEILKAKDYESFREIYPYFLKTLVRLWKEKQLATENKGPVVETIDRNLDLDTFDKNGLPSHSEISATALDLLTNWVNKKEEMKRKRTYHRALCHFKICNMGSKRSFWDIWNNNHPST